MQLLLTKILDSLNPKDFNLDNYFNDSPIGGFLEVDRDYSDQLHDLQNGYPLAGKKIKITEEILPEYQLQITEVTFVLVKIKCLFLI